MTGTGPSPLGAAWQVAQYLFLFTLVLGLAYLFSRSLRRLAPFARSRHLRLLDQLHLGPSRAFYLLAVAGKVVLVAMGEGGVATVTTLDDPGLVEDLLKQADQPSQGAAGEGGPAGLARLIGLGNLAGRGGRALRGSFADLLAQAQQGPQPSPQQGPAADRPGQPEGAGELALRRQVERLRRLAERTGTGTEG